MKYHNTSVLVIAIAGLALISAPAKAASVLLSLGVGNNPDLTENNTSFVVPPPVSGWTNYSNGSTLSDDTGTTGLVMTITSGNPGSSLLAQGTLARVGSGTAQGVDGWNDGDIMDFTFNLPVSLNSLFFGTGGTGREAAVTAFVNGVDIGTNATSFSGSTEFTYDDSTVLAAGQTLRLVAPTVAVGASGAGLSGIEVEVIPEPSSTAILGLGGLALILRRRR